MGIPRRPSQVMEALERHFHQKDRPYEAVVQCGVAAGQKDPHVGKGSLQPSDILFDD